MSRSRNWCFTINVREPRPCSAFEHWLLSLWPDPGQTGNPRRQDCYPDWYGAAAIADVFDYSGIKYLVAQFERGADGGTPHWQGYLELGGVSRLAALRRVCPAGHWEPRGGTREQAVAYCRKPETAYPGSCIEFGKPPPGAGARSDLASFCDFLRAGPTERAVADAYGPAYLKYPRWRQFSALYAPPRTEAPKVSYFWGPPGAGKTHRVFDSHEASTIYRMTLYAKNHMAWFDFYDPMHHTVLLLDEYRSSFNMSFLLSLLDKWPLIVQTKGGHVNFRCSHIYLTSNLSLEEQHPEEQDPHTRGALRRRIHVLEHFEPRPLDGL